MKIVKLYLILILALIIMGLISCSSRFTPRKNDIDNCEKADLNNMPTNIFEKLAGKTYSGNGDEYVNTFSADGKTITHIENGKTNTYVYSNENNNIAVYYNENGEALRLDTQYGELYYCIETGETGDKRMRMDIL